MNNDFRRIYLCGPVSKRPLHEVVTHFFTVEQNIMRAGRQAYSDKKIGYISTLNPVRLCPLDLEWDRAMSICIGEMVRCGGVALLQGWQQSKGAAFELEITQKLHIPVVYVEPPLDEKNLSDLFSAAPETLRYFNARLAQFQKEGVEESLAEERALAELANRYLDPYGFEYINVSEEK